MEVVDITPEGFKTPTKKENSSPVVSSSKIVKSPTLMPTRTKYVSFVVFSVFHAYLFYRSLLNLLLSCVSVMITGKISR